MARARLGEFPWLDDATPPAGRRVIVDNDFAGDPDDLYQLVHHVLSPSVEIVGVIGSHLSPGDPFHPGHGSALAAVRRVHEVLDAMGIDPGDRVWAGAEDALADRTTPRRSPAAEAIVREAMRSDVTTPLYVAAGGGLTDLASAYLIEPAIAGRVQVVWIGGSELPGTAPEPPGVDNPEYNLRIDRLAAQVVVDDSGLPLWLVPRDVYRQCLVSFAELRTKVRPHGPIGRLLYDALADVRERIVAGGGPTPETYALGDSPLVLLTALQSSFQPDPSSSSFVVAAPTVDDDGAFDLAHEGRQVRVYRHVDTRLMFDDMFAKLAEFDAWFSG